LTRNEKYNLNRHGNLQRHALSSMASNRNFLNYHEEEASSSSSSSRSPNEHRPPAVHDDTDELDHFFDNHDRNDANDVLGDDPLNGHIGDTPMSFKRKQKQSIFSRPNRMLSALFGSPAPAPGHSSTGTETATSTLLQTFDSRRDSGAFASDNGPKDGVPLDWYVEGLGKRVGYEDLTAIDWIFEYTKERQRLRVLYSSATGFIGYLRLLADSSQVWIVLVLTGLAVGALAAGIDVVSDWLGDIKTGYCSSGPDGGAFYLNKQFCCWGYDQGAKCSGWKPWAVALGIGTAAGKWFIEYIFFLIFSVSVTTVMLQPTGSKLTPPRLHSPSAQGF
jgi:chloride channel 3/4/5